MKILGISAYYHDSAAALVVDGRIVAAAQEERFTRIKHDSGFPAHSIRFCLETAGLKLSEIDHFVFYDKPLLKFERILETYLAFAPRGFPQFMKALPVWVKEKLFQKKLLNDQLKELNGGEPVDSRLLFCEHHLSHAASAFYPSPFRDAAVLTMDGVGEWATTSLAVGQGNQLNIHAETFFPHSIGLLYSAFTYYTGFKVNSGEYKLMGLAPYGEPKYAQLIRDHLVDIRPDGSFRLDVSYFDYCVGLKMANAKFERLFSRPARAPESPLEQFHMDIAASIQAVTEEIVLRLAISVREETGLRNLCLAGGVALNCVANGKLWRSAGYDQIWVQPAAGDAGASLGAALYAHYAFLNQPRVPDAGLDGMRGSYLGPRYGAEEIKACLDRIGARYTVLPEEQLYEKVVSDLENEKAVGWFQGAMEFGPRALGGRSIIADPRSPRMQKTLNLRVKFRESFRPFAPAVLRESVNDWFEFDGDSPYMLFVAPVKQKRCREMSGSENSLFGIEKLNVQRSEIPAVTHVDYSARLQTVHKETNPRFHALLNSFGKRTGCPVLVNTSFNVRGEPIVCSPEDAFRCFMGTDIETLVVENFYLAKDAQDPALVKSYVDRFELD